MKYVVELPEGAELPKQGYLRNAKPYTIDSEIYLCAMRYALGRRTYVVDEVCNAIKAHIRDLDAKDIWVMERDLCYAELGNNLGDPTIDAPRWRELMNALEDELERREHEHM